MKKIFVLLVLIVFIFPVAAKAQFWKRKINQMDAQNRKQGLWIVYWDDDNKITMSKYHFKDGRETKVCKNYHPNGKISIKFKYNKDRIKVKYYDEEGKITQKGWSIIKYDEEVHYYWHGRWKFFDAKHKIIRTAMYLNGSLMNATDSERKNKALKVR